MTRLESIVWLSSLTLQLRVGFALRLFVCLFVQKCSPGFIHFWLASVCFSPVLLLELKMYFVTIKTFSLNVRRFVDESRWPIRSVFPAFFQRLFFLVLELSHMAFNWSHEFIYSIPINVSCMSYFSTCSWPCIVLFNCYSVYSFYFKCLGCLVLRNQHVYSASHFSLIISNGLKQLSCIYSDAFITPRASVNISSGCWLLSRCYSSSFVLFFPVWQKVRDNGNLQSVSKTVVPNC